MCSRVLTYATKHKLTLVCFALTCNVNSKSLIHLKRQISKPVTLWEQVIKVWWAQNEVTTATWWKCCSLMVWRRPEELIITSLTVRPAKPTCQEEQISFHVRKSAFMVRHLTRGEDMWDWDRHGLKLLSLPLTLHHKLQETQANWINTAYKTTSCPSIYNSKSEKVGIVWKTQMKKESNDL